MDVFTLIASYMPANVIAAQHIMRQVTVLTFMVPIGFNTAAMILVGNNIGADKVSVGKAYAHLCVRTGAIWALGTVVLLALLRGPFVGVFTQSG